MGPDEPLNDLQIELPDMGTLNLNAVETTTITGYLNDFMDNIQTITAADTLRLDILNEVKKMSAEEKRQMLLLLLDAFDDSILEKTKVTEKILKINRLKQILGHPKNSAS